MIPQKEFGKLRLKQFVPEEEITKLKDWKFEGHLWRGEALGFSEWLRLNSDLKVRKSLQDRLSQAAVSRIQIERPAKSARITIHTARPGIVIGKKGEDIERLRRDVSALMGVPTHITVAEIRKPELDAKLVAEGIAQQLERLDVRVGLRQRESDRIAEAL